MYFFLQEGYRMASYNRVIIMGNLTKEPDHKQLTSGQSVCKLGLASNRQFKNKQTGAMIQEVCFIDVDVWGPQADSCNQYLQKGSAVLIEGRLKFDTWQDNEGQKRSKHSIVADRVTFLPASQSVQNEDLTSSDNNYNKQVTNSTKENEDIEKNQKNKKEEDLTGEIDFKDEKPFDDDLPF
ncbi:single-stranded DNA-binding protein [Candidatus Dependentiae bacterium]|nr:single-stranded DNA-binding protein [Candidatus Dependentiae bacterium]